MKTMIKLLAYLMLASLPMSFTGAKPDSAPGIQKKSLETFNVRVVKVGADAIISWETNFRSSGSVAIDDYAILDATVGTRHSVTIPFVIEGLEYFFSLYSVSEIYGASIPYEGSFKL